MVFPGIVDPPTLEALACREALDLADDLGLRRILISSDCKQVVQDITDGSGGRYATVIKEIQMHSREFAHAKFIHEGRSLNVEAHNLARYALSLGQGRHLWLLEPYDPVLLPAVLAFDL